LDFVPVESDLVLLASIPGYPDTTTVELTKDVWPTVSSIVHSVTIVLESGAFQMASFIFLAAVAAIDLPRLLLRYARLGGVEVQLHTLRFFEFGFGFGKSGSSTGDSKARHLFISAISSSGRDRGVAPYVLMELLGSISLASDRHNIRRKSDSCTIFNLGRRSGT